MVPSAYAESVSWSTTVDYYLYDRYSVEFPDPVELLQVAEKMGLEGIVSKRADQPYVSGRNPGWVKVKSRAWREASKDRSEMFQRASK